MNDTNLAELVELGLSPTEAQVYLTLVQSAALSASAIATATGLSRTSVYQILCGLTDRGLIESGTGYGSRFAAVAPERALPALIAAEQETLAYRKGVAGRLSERLTALAEPIETIHEEVIQVIRNPRAVAERFEKLQLEAERQTDCFTKPPFFNRTRNQGERALRHGVRVRSLYERAALEDPAVKPFLATWVAAGEEARVYDGELPHKLAIFDSKIVLMPLILPGEQTKTILIRHPQLAQTLGLAFEFLWQQSKPLLIEEQKPISKSNKKSIKAAPKLDRRRLAIDRNGQPVIAPQKAKPVKLPSRGRSFRSGPALP